MSALRAGDKEHHGSRAPRHHALHGRHLGDVFDGRAPGGKGMGHDLAGLVDNGGVAFFAEGHGPALLDDILGGHGADVEPVFNGPQHIQRRLAFRRGHYGRKYDAALFEQPEEFLKAFFRHPFGTRQT
jgi:hypothetical protein